MPRTSRKNKLTSVCKLLWKQETLLNKHLILLIILVGFFFIVSYNHASELLLLQLYFLQPPVPRPAHTSRFNDSASCVLNCTDFH